MDTTDKTALVLGATGGIGGAVARKLAARGWRVRGLARDPAKGAAVPGLRWVAGDAMCGEDVAAAAEGADLIVHAVNPPGYRNWSTLVLPMIDNTIAAARRSGARVLLPGTVYNYGPDASPLIDELSVQHPATRKGRIRVAMEERLQAAADDGGIRVLIVRAGDFFGPGGRNNWFSQGLVQPGGRPTAITYPGWPGVGHQWAYLPDVAETMVRLAGRVDLPRFASFHMDGHFDPDGTAMITAIRRVLGAPDLPVKAMPWWLMRLASPVVPLFRELSEMRYLWQTSVRLDNRRLVALLGDEPRTVLDDAVAATLRDMGCLAQNPAAAGEPAALGNGAG